MVAGEAPVFPITGMIPTPGSYPLDVPGAAPIIAIDRFGEPALLAPGFAGFTAGRPRTKPLPMALSRIGPKERVAGETTAAPSFKGGALVLPPEAGDQGSHSERMGLGHHEDRAEIWRRGRDKRGRVMVGESRKGQIRALRHRPRAHRPSSRWIGYSSRP